MPLVSLHEIIFCFFQISVRLTICCQIRNYYFFFRASGICKHVGCLLWFVEREVRLGHNLTCTSKPQQWNVPSKKQQKLHHPSLLQQISIKKPKVEQILNSKPTTSFEKTQYDPRAAHQRKTSQISRSDLDILASATNGNCGIVFLMREHDVNSEPDLEFINNEEIIDQSPNIDYPKYISDIMCILCGNDLSFEDFKSNFKSMVAITSQRCTAPVILQFWHFFL